MKLIFTVIILFFNLSAIAQGIIDTEGSTLSRKEFAELTFKRQQNELNKIGVIIEPPSKYVKLERKLYDTDLGSIDYAFINKDSSALIAIVFQSRDSTDYINEKAAILRASPERKDYDPNDQWLFNFKAFVDSTSFKPIYYEHAKLKKYNADAGVEYKIKEGRVFFDEYILARAVMLNKKYRGFITICYLTRPGSDINLTSQIKMGEKIISYK